MKMPKIEHQINTIQKAIAANLVRVGKAGGEKWKSLSDEVNSIPQYSNSCTFYFAIYAEAGAEIHVVQVESADSIPNLDSIITESDGAMFARGDLSAELPVEELPLLQEEIIRICHSMGKAVIVATNMLESMIEHPTPARTEYQILLSKRVPILLASGATAHGKFTLKAVVVMHTVSLRTESTVVAPQAPLDLGEAFKNHTCKMFAFHTTKMSNSLGTSLVRCLHQNWVHGYFTGSLPAIWHNLCLHNCVGKANGEKWNCGSH